MYHDPLTQYVAHRSFGSIEDDQIGSLEAEIAENKAKLATLTVGQADHSLLSLTIERQNIQLARLKRKKNQNPYLRGAFFLLSATAMAVSYSRNQSFLKSFGASLVSVPYLIYVAIDSRKNK